MTAAICGRCGEPFPTDCTCREPAALPAGSAAFTNRARYATKGEVQITLSEGELRCILIALGKLRPTVAVPEALDLLAARLGERIPNGLLSYEAGQF